MFVNILSYQLKFSTPFPFSLSLPLFFPSFFLRRIHSVIQAGLGSLSPSSAEVHEPPCLVRLWLRMPGLCHSACCQQYGVCGGGHLCFRQDLAFSPGLPGFHNATQCGLKIMAIFLPQLSECWDCSLSDSVQFLSRQDVSYTATPTTSIHMQFLNHREYRNSTVMKQPLGKKQKEKKRKDA